MMFQFLKYGAWVLGLATVLTTTAHGETTSASDVGRQLRSAVEAIKSYTIEKKDEAVEEGESALDAAGREIEELELRARNSGDRAASEWREQRSRLTTLRAASEERLQQLRNSSASAWDEAKSGASAAFDDLRRAMENAREAFDDK